MTYRTSAPVRLANNENKTRRQALDRIPGGDPSHRRGPVGRPAAAGRLFFYYAGLRRRRARLDSLQDGMFTGAVSRMRLRFSVALCAAVLAFIVTTTAGAGAASAAEPEFNAHGSVEQVYVTDLSPGEQVSLLNSAGSTVATRQANSLGGSLFRNVPPGSG